MEIIDDEYEVLSNVQDVGMMLMPKVQDKDIELFTTINPSLPRYLYGDYLRIRQILINIVNNAIKFTKHGYVKVDMDYDVIDEEHINFRFTVKDTGIGISEENLGKLFESFQQLDSKRNRSVEGTGLGLAICKRLVTLMGGDISVKSKYGEGSEFSFWVPQKVINWEPCIKLDNRDDIAALSYFRNKDIEGLIDSDLEKLGVSNIVIPNLDEFEDVIKKNKKLLADKKLYFYTEDRVYDEEVKGFVDLHPDINFIALRSFGSISKSDKSNVQFAKKPVSTLLIRMTLSNDVLGMQRESDVFEFDFVAPDANVLIVDDNEVNLSVAEGLLKPLEMNVTTALSGVKALEYLEYESYDIVFMDHMMPELDGVETTHIIRRLHPELKDMPIIALTANAIGEAQKMFLAEGMDDFVAKPIEMKTFISKVRHWLPAEKIHKRSENPIEKASLVGDAIPIIGDLNIEAALTLIGSMDIYYTILEKYYSAIENKADVIKKCEEAEDISTYTIEVHALKSSSRQIGALELSEQAARLEQAGKDNDVQFIHDRTPHMIEKYLSYIEVIGNYIKEPSDESENKLPFNIYEIKDLFNKLHVACDELDMDEMERLTKEIGQYEFDEHSASYYRSLKESVDGLDSFTCEDILNEWESQL